MSRGDTKAAFEAHGGTLSEPLSEVWRTNDFDALMARRFGRGLLSNQMLAEMSVPTLFYCGTADTNHAGMERAAEQMPNATFLTLDGYDHAAGASPSATELVMPRIKDLLARVEAELAPA